MTARNVGTGAVQVTTSDSEGRYTIPALPVGDYEVQTELQGFQTVIRTGIRLSAGADVVVDFDLPIGQVTEALTVTAAAPLVNTTSASLGTVVDPTQIRELPLNGRNFEELVLVAPGVNVSRGSGSSQERVHRQAGVLERLRLAPQRAGDSDGRYQHPDLPESRNRHGHPGHQPGR